MSGTREVHLDSQPLMIKVRDQLKQRKMTRLDLAAELGIQPEEALTALNSLEYSQVCGPVEDLKYAHLRPEDRPWVYEPGSAARC